MSKSKKVVWFLFESPNVYDGYCATVYKDGTFELRDHWAVNRLSKAQKAELRKEILQSVEQSKIERL